MHVSAGLFGFQIRLGIRGRGVGRRLNIGVLGFC